MKLWVRKIKFRCKWWTTSKINFQWLFHDSLHFPCCAFPDVLQNGFLIWTCFIIQLLVYCWSSVIHIYKRWLCTPSYCRWEESTVPAFQWSRWLKQWRFSIFQPITRIAAIIASEWNVQLGFPEMSWNFSVILSLGMILCRM